MKRFRGLTARQQDVLGAIAMGRDTGHSPKILATLLERGLIVKLVERVVGRDAFGLISIPQYEMPIPAHMEWCQWCADNYVDCVPPDILSEANGGEYPYKGKPRPDATNSATSPEVKDEA